MPKLTDITVQRDKDLVFQVWLLMRRNQKLSVVKACQQVGVTTDFYYRWIKECDDVLDAFRTAQIEIQRNSLARIITAREAILDQLIIDANSKFIDPLTRLGIYQFLLRHMDDLIEEVGVHQREAADFLNGPTLKPATSRFVASGVEITIRTSNPEPPIDITPRDVSE